MLHDLLVESARELGLVAGALAAAGGIWWGFSRNRREERSQAMVEADKTVELLEKQNALLEEQLLETKAEIKRRSEEWQMREAKLEGRIERLEYAYQSLISTVTTMRLCARAPTCANYSPGAVDPSEL